ncbi:uncharacterized protein MKK02DRAFT_38774 [Dioszegia hungarica]|uniref:Protein BIG1 n=1 Tax=Dioszegia hungarica TaxID=4972 RepID=A0AA38H4R1_9TREE|nr:uncharacterized protein MKK02DRAFT_38774 [Dioszegia hungarica]KAI9634103.1 hypothetical protein MKK02DRAFT_38774 [Dioszegia hungarica]
MRSTAYSVLAAALLATATSAFKDSSPLLIWSSNDKESLREAQEALTSGVIAADEIYRTLPTLGCEWDRVVVVHMDELHHSHIPSLKIASAADLHVPYLINPDRPSLDGALGEWAQICGAEIVSSDSGVEGGKQIIRVEGGKSSLNGEALATFPSADLTILTGTRPVKRQQPDELERPLLSVTSSSSSAHRRPTHTASSSSTASHPSSTHGNSTTVSKDAPLLDRVQLLTTPIITALLISLLIFVPVVMFGVSALAGIQVPPRMLEIGKGMTVGKDKKDQ